MVSPIGSALSGIGSTGVGSTGVASTGVGSIDRLIAPASSEAVRESGGGFESVLGQLAQVQQGADGALTDLAVNNDAELHDVVLAVEMESLAFDLAVQIRNRLVDAYQEIFRMSV